MTRRFLKESGVDQWQNGYPTREIYEADIEKGFCHVFMVEGKLAGVISVFFEPEECYELVYDGKWLTGNAQYALFHRAAVADECRGRELRAKCYLMRRIWLPSSGFRSLRGDTHRDNKTMRGLLEKSGFVHCGTIYLSGARDTQNERVCYEKLL